MHYACDKQMKSWADLELIASQGLGSDTSMRTQIVIGEMLGRFRSWLCAIYKTLFLGMI